MANDSPFGFHMRLYSESGYNLTIRKNGEILGTQDDKDADSCIEICSGGSTGHVRLFGLNNNLYVCYARTGELYGESNPSNPGTIFLEEFQGSYTAYKSFICQEWYVGIKKSGLPKRGDQTRYGQKAVKFLTRRH